MITEPFPTPPAPIEYALDQLHSAQTGSQEQREEIGDPAALPRPWDPATCPPSLRCHLWQWLDDVAAWLNRGYAWTPADTIPACWPEHPHITHELATLACQRVAAAAALTPDRLEEWHRYTLPGFLDRMKARLGPTGCPPGRHTPWPARARHTDYTSTAAARQREQRYADDTSK